MEQLGRIEHSLYLIRGSRAHATETIPSGIVLAGGRGGDSIFFKDTKLNISLLVKTLKKLGGGGSY